MEQVVMNRNIKMRLYNYLFYLKPLQFDIYLNKTIIMCHVDKYGWYSSPSKCHQSWIKSVFFSWLCHVAYSFRYLCVFLLLFSQSNLPNVTNFSSYFSSQYVQQILTLSECWILILILYSLICYFYNKYVL